MCWWWVGMVWRGSWKGLRQGNLREGIERGRCHHLLLLGRLRWWWKGARDCRHPLTKVLPITMWSVLKVLSPHLTWWQTSAPLYYSCFPRLTPGDLSITSTQVSPMYEHLAQVSVVRKVGLAGNLARPLTHCYQVWRLRQSCAEGRVLRIGIRVCSHISQPGERREWWGGVGWGPEWELFSPDSSLRGGVSLVCIPANGTPLQPKLWLVNIYYSINHIYQNRNLI